MDKAKNHQNRKTGEHCSGKEAEQRLDRNPCKEPERFVHPVQPLYDSLCRVLILGTFPSPKSREAQFFYHHPQNRFWRVMAGITDSAAPLTIPEKKALMLDNHIALWDVVESCIVKGASDSSIRNVVPADLKMILSNAPIRAIFANGDTAARLYMKHHYPITKIPIIRLPSTSPANAAFRLDRLIEEWKQITEWIQG